MEKTIHLNAYEEDANENSNEISENIKFENEFKFLKKSMMEYQSIYIIL